MKRTLLRSTLTALVAACALTASAQGVAINSTGAAPDPLAMVDVTGVAPVRGLLIPRMTEADRLAIPVVAASNGLWVYQTDDNTTQHGLWYYDNACACPGPAWRRMADGRGWNFGGNTGTNDAVNYIGTADAIDLVFRTNNVERMRVAATGEVGIGNPAPAEALHVTGGVRLDDPVNANGSIGNLSGTIRYNPVSTYHEGNVNNTPAGYQRLENAEQRVVNAPYEGFQLICGPGSATGSAYTGNSTNQSNTPFVTANSSGRVQYIFRAAELTALGLCPGNVTEIALYVLDDDNTSAPQTAINAEITLNNTALNAFAGAFDAATIALPPNGTLTNLTIGSGILPMALTTPYFWNGVSNVIIDICWTRGGNTGVSPRVQLTTPVGYNATRYGVVTSLPILGCTITDASPAGGITRGQSNSRPVFRFTGQALTPQPIVQNADYVRYGGGLMVEETPGWAASGVFQGPGVIRAENAVYDGTIQLSDHVFDLYFDGQVREEDRGRTGNYQYVPLAALKDHLATERHLPGMPSRADWEQQGTPSLGRLSTGLWQAIETQALYIGELEQQLSILEDLVAKGERSAELEQRIKDTRGLRPDQKEYLLRLMGASAEGTEEEAPKH